MRKPTPIASALAWHSDSLNGLAPAMHPEEPQCGWFKRRLVKGGPFVPARIWLEQEIDPVTGELLADEVLRCEVNGNTRDPHEEWQWLCGITISEREFKYKTALRQHCAWHEPNDPSVNPRQPVDWSRIPTPRFT